MPIRSSSSIRGSAHGAGAFGVTAERLRRAGDYVAAIEVCRQGLALHPGHVGARVSLGLSLMATGHDDEAFAALAEALRLAPDNLAAIRGLAELHERGVGGDVADPSMFELPDMPDALTVAPATAAPEVPASSAWAAVPVEEPTLPEPVVEALAPALSATAAIGSTPLPVAPLGVEDVPAVAAVVPEPGPVEAFDLARAFSETIEPHITSPTSFAEPLAVATASETDVVLSTLPDPFEGLRLDDLDPEVLPDNSLSLAGDFTLEDVVSALDEPAEVPAPFTAAAALDALDPLLPPEAPLQAEMLGPLLDGAAAESISSAGEHVVPLAPAGAAVAGPNFQASVVVQASIVVQGAVGQAPPAAATASMTTGAEPQSSQGTAEAGAAVTVPGPVPGPTTPAATAQVVVAAAVSVQPVAVLPEGPAAVLEEWLTRIHTRRREILSEYAAS